jgi:hypothetical protein
LTGAEVKANKEDWTLTVKGGKENADLLVKVPSNVFEKWHQVLRRMQFIVNTFSVYVRPCSIMLTQFWSMHTSSQFCHRIHIGQM